MWIALTAAVALAITPEQVRDPRPTGWVSDMAGVIDADDEAAINARISALNRDRGVQIAVVTVPSVDDGTPKQFATGLFNHWGIGSAARDDGLLVLLAVEQRRLEMETGYGLEASLPDGWLGVMQSQRMVPRFKKGDFGGGIDAGLEAVDARLRGSEPPPITGGRVASTAPSFRSPVPVGLLIGGSVGLLGLFGLFLLIDWKRKRTCPDCRIPMLPLPEDQEDAHLSDGQEAEEAIGAARWDVYQCPECERVRSFGTRTLFSGYSRCPSCQFTTRSTRRTTLVYPTEQRSGSAQVTERCAHCSYESSRMVTLARLPDPSTTSSYSSSSSSSWGGGSGGGGGWGGGSSGGGGAGSSW